MLGTDVPRIPRRRAVLLGSHADTGGTASPPFSCPLKYVKRPVWGPVRLGKGIVPLVGTADKGREHAAAALQWATHALPFAIRLLLVA